MRDVHVICIWELVHFFKGVCSRWSYYGLCKGVSSFCLDLHVLLYCWFPAYTTSLSCSFWSIQYLHLIQKKKVHLYTKACSSMALAGFALPMCPGFEPSHVRLSPPRCLTCLLGLQDVQWVRGLVMVRVSWPGHPGLSKKKVHLYNVSHKFQLLND
jgi:hypothetical protein